MKRTSQKSRETVRDYDKCCKDLLSQLDYVIDEKLLIQWFLARISHKIWMHINMDTFNTYEYALAKALQADMDEEYPRNPVENCIEEQLEIMQKSIRGLNLKGKDIWCTK